MTNNIHQFRKSLDSKARVEGYTKAAVTYLRETDRMQAHKQEQNATRQRIHDELEFHLRRLWAYDGEANAKLTVDMLQSKIKLGAK